MYFYANYIEGRSVNWGMEIERMDESAIEDKSGLMGIYNEIKDKVEGYSIDLGWIEVEVNGVGSRWYKDVGETVIRVKGIEKDIEDNTEEWLEEYSKLAGEGMMDDMEYRILTELIRKGVIKIYGEEHIVVIRDNNRGYGVIDEGEEYEEGEGYEKGEGYKKGEGYNKITGDQGSGGGDNRVSIRKKNTEFEDDMEYIYRVMLSERGMGYWNISGYEEKGVHVDIGYEYEIEFGGKKYILPAYYGVALRDAMMKDISKNRLGKRGIGGNNGAPKSVPTFQRWQYEIVRDFSHKTVVANSRRSGKSVLSAYFAIRELLRENYRGMMKRIIYIGLTMEKTETVWKYLQGMLRRFQTVSGVFKLKTGQGKRTIEFITDDKKKIVDGTVELISAESKAAGVGEYADLLVIDEASRMSVEVYNNVQPIIDLEGAKAYIISTVYWDTVKNWFYKMLTYAERWSMTKWKEARNKRLRNVIGILDEINTDWETGTYLFETDENGEYMYSEDERKQIARKNFEAKHEEYYEILSENWYEMEFLGRRYTIDDITRLNKREKERAKENMKKTDIMRYYCEYYSVFPGQGKVFQVEGRLVKRLSEEYDKIYIGYDPAKLSDSAGFVCIGIREDGKVEVIKSERLKSTDYKIQIEKLEELKEEMESYYKCKVVKVMDITGVGVAVEELMRHMGNKIDVAIMWKGSGEQKYERGIFKVLKRDLVGTAEVLFQRRKIFIYTDDNKDLIDEINNYESIKTPSGNIKYETTGDYDDLVSAMLVALYTYLKLDGGERRVFADMQSEKQLGMTYKQVHSILSKMTEQRDRDKRTKIRQTLYFQ